MAYTEENVREEVIKQMTFRRQTDRTITDADAFRRELAAVREKGYALDARELEEHMECVGAPIFGQDGNVAGAISASSLYKPTEDYDALGHLIRAKAEELSTLLGFLGKS
jgi:DNA-binding IclR family transcriptional regulator